MLAQLEFKSAINEKTIKRQVVYDVLDYNCVHDVLDFIK